jgi:hypothetical protein
MEVEWMLRIDDTYKQADRMRHAASRPVEPEVPRIT